MIPERLVFCVWFVMGFVTAYVTRKVTIWWRIKKSIRLEPQPEGGYVSFSSVYPGAIGQGETEEEAIRDIQEAIALLRGVENQEAEGGES